MPKELSPLARELRKETCPQRVLDEVGRRISTHRPAPGPLRFALPLLTVGLVLACCRSVWQWQAGENARRQAKLAERAAADRAQIARQAKDSLELMGTIVLKAGVRSEEVIFHRAIPPMRDSFQLAKNKIIQSLQP